MKRKTANGRRAAAFILSSAVLFSAFASSVRAHGGEDAAPEAAGYGDWVGPVLAAAIIAAAVVAAKAIRRRKKGGGGNIAS